jgi:hypothetical protein
MAPWPSARDLGTKKVLKDLERERIEKKIAVARADIVIAKIRGDMCRDFLCDAERYLESGQINPGNICELIDRYYKGYNPQLLRSALTALTRVNSQAMADRIINRIDAIHRLHGRADYDVGVARLTHPAGG